MARPPRIDRESGIYHVTSRGNARADVFFQDEDRERFLERLRDNLETYHIILYAYVLMDNHFHLLVETPDANLSRFVQRLKTAYALYLRYKRKKPGHIFQGRFHAKLVDGPAYLARVSRYIHLNPVRTRAAMRLSEEERLERLRAYRWSSFGGYLRSEKNEPFLQTAPVLREFGGRDGAWGSARRAYRRYVESCVSRSDPETINLMRENPYVIGSQGFALEIEEELAVRRRGFSADADIGLPRKRVSLEAIDHAVCAHLGVAPLRLKRHGRAAGGEAKAVAVELACLLTGLTQRAVGEWYGAMTSSGVSNIRRKVKRNARLSEIVASIKRDIERVAPPGRRKSESVVQ